MMIWIVIVLIKIYPIPLDIGILRMEQCFIFNFDLVDVEARENPSDLMLNDITSILEARANKTIFSQLNILLEEIKTTY